MRQRTRLGAVAGLVGISFLIGGIAVAEPVEASEGVITIPTYPWEPEDLNPRYYEFENSIIYPYTMQDNLSATKTDRQYKTLVLENEYLRVICIPELGGRIHSVLDKTKNEEMFHLNQVIKPALIALRGAWISGGIEWNAGPQGHTVHMVTPVDATYVKHDDGSASLVIGNTEKIFRTRWTVELTLRPGKAFLEERISIYNPTDGFHPYYFWNNTAFPCRPGTRYIYPMSLGTDHFGRTFFNWPIHEGRDMTWLKNYRDMTSTFAYNCVYDFFGAYDVDADRGIVQYANHGLVPGKKAWTWGQADFGLVSQESLTDEDGPYIEVQSGPLATQSDYEFLAPRQRVMWKEWWYPVHGMGDGFEYCTRDVAIQSYRRDGGLELRILATGEFPDAKCVLKEDEKELVTQRLSLTPREPQTLKLDSAPENVQVLLTASDGTVLAEYTTPLPIPKETAPTFPADKSEDQMTAEELFVKAARLDKDTNRPGARAGYEKVLAKDPDHAGALRALAVLDIESGLYEQARDRLTRCVARRVDDSYAWSLLGLAQLRLKEYDKAIETAYRGARLLDAAGFAWDVAGRAKMQKGQYFEAAQDFLRAAQVQSHDTRAWDHWMLALEASGQKENAVRMAKERLAEDPLAIIPRVILITSPASDARGTDPVKSLGETEFELLDAAWICTEVGKPELAIQLLDRLAQPSALVAYHQAYFGKLAGSPDFVNESLQEAKSLSTDYVFPSFPESVDVFKFAVEKDPNDANAWLLLGNLYAGLGRMDEAVPAWEKAVGINSKLSVAFRNLAMHARKVQNDAAKADGLLAKAIEARPDDEILYRDRADALIALNRRPEAITLLANRPIGERARPDATILLVRSYIDEKQYDNALHVLETSDFSNWEGQTDSWDLFNRGRVERGKIAFEQKDYAKALDDFSAALTYPKMLRVGRPVSPRESEAQYWKGRALQALGRMDEARAAWQEGAAGDENTDVQKKHIEMCRQALELTAPK